MFLGLIDTPNAWTADPQLAMAAVIAVDVWKTTPFMTLLILAALQLLPGEVYEAGKVDGISPVKMFFKVTLPLIKPALMVAIIFRSLDALRMFDLMYVITGNSQVTATMSIYARQQLVDFQLRLGGLDPVVPDHRPVHGDLHHRGPRQLRSAALGDRP